MTGGSRSRRAIESAPIEGKVVDSVERYLASYDDFEFTDSQVAERFSADALVGSYCWVGELGWLAWDSRRWRDIPNPVMLGVVRNWVKSEYVRTAGLIGEAREIGNKDAVGRLRYIHGQWYNYQSAGKLGAVARLSQPDVVHRLSEFDAKPDLLNVRNGVINLSTGELMPHDPALMLTQLADVDYKPGATHKDWAMALEAIPEDLQGWFQLRCGQSITGYKPDDDAVIVEHGGGANGKNTIMEAYGKTLGDYFKMASPRVLLGNPDQHPTELADLYAARMVWLDELPEGRYLPATRIKNLTAGQLPARKIGKDPLVLEVLFSLFVSTNYLPAVNETDEGTWRRLFLLRFPYQFRKPGQPGYKPGDASLRQRVKRGRGQREAILAWLVEGAQMWYANDREFPKPDPVIIEDDRIWWRKRDDSIWRFIDEQLEFDSDAHVMSKDLFQQFTLWQAAQNQKPWGDRTFVERLTGNEIIAEHNVFPKKGVRKRAGSGLSRPDGVVSLAMIPEQYNAWFGLRFKEPAITFEY